jgi:hypothetical protein
MRRQLNDGDWMTMRKVWKNDEENGQNLQETPELARAVEKV